MTIQTEFARVIETIEAYDLPLNQMAIQQFNSEAREGKYNGSMGMVLRNILNLNVDALHELDASTPEEHSRVQVAYVIDGAITAHMNGRTVNPKELYNIATKKAHTFIKEMPWVFATKEENIKLDANGKQRAKKGMKQVKAYDVYCQSIKDGRTRKEIIEAFQTEVNMTKAGATTYFYNMKKRYETENA